MNLTRRLTEGVGAWLHFEFCCHRSGLFNERYLSAAVGQILSATYGDRVHAEFEHPILAANLVHRGRRPAIDFAYCENYPHITLAVETKWAGSSNTTVESVIWDLVRLELVAHHHGAECIFILAGKHKDLENFFASVKFSGPSNTPGVTSILRTTSNSRVSLSLLPDKHYRISLFRRVFASLQNISVPHRIITRRSNPFPADCKNNQFQVYAWEILPAADRQEFIPANIKHYRIPQFMDS
jgi:hypothetical protein